MPKKKSSMGPIWAVIIAGAVLMVIVQFLPDKENAQMGPIDDFFFGMALIYRL